MGDRVVYGVLGNHEHAVYGFSIPLIKEWNVLRRQDMKDVSTRLESAGVRLLSNRRVSIPYLGSEVVLAGVDDMFNKAADLEKALAGLDSLQAVVLLCHSPDMLGEASQRGVPLVLSGHTHGGQVRLPPFGVLTTGTKYPMQRPCGVLERGQTLMHVSPGLGLSFPPFRLFTRPEATLLELRSEQGSRPSS